jgi:hypothetical protein
MAIPFRKPESRNSREDGKEGDTPGESVDDWDSF